MFAINLIDKYMYLNMKIKSINLQILVKYHRSRIQRKVSTKYHVINLCFINKTGKMVLGSRL